MRPRRYCGPWWYGYSPVIELVMYLARVQAVGECNGRLYTPPLYYSQTAFVSNCSCHLVPGTDSDDEVSCDSEAESESNTELAKRAPSDVSGVLDDVAMTPCDVYSSYAQETCHVAPFVKIAFPDLYAHKSVDRKEMMFQKNSVACR